MGKLAFIVMEIPLFLLRISNENIIYTKNKPIHF
jgi:hypothetical protein